MGRESEKVQGQWGMKKSSLGQVVQQFETQLSYYKVVTIATSLNCEDELS